MTDQNLVSIIVPTHDRPEQLRGCLQSIVQQQTEYPYEVIVVNDAGVDVHEVVFAAANVARGPFYYFEHTENKGLAATRNTALSHAVGKLICYLDDDDIFYPNHIQTLISALENKKLGVVYSDAFKAIGDFADGRFLAVTKVLEYSNNVDKEAILIQNRVPVLCYMHRAEALAKVGNFDESFEVFEDWDFLGIRMAQKYNYLHIPLPTAEYRWHLDGSNMSNRGRGEDFWKKYFIKMYIKHLGLGSPATIAWRKQWLKNQGYTFQAYNDTSLFQGRKRRKR